MDSQFHLEAGQNSLYSEIITISSDEEEAFSDGVSVVSSEFEENMMDVEAQLLAMSIDDQLSTPVAVRGRQMTLDLQTDCSPESTPLHCGGPRLEYEMPGTSRMTGQADERSRGWDHPIARCCKLIPFVDTPMSPPLHERGFMTTPLNDLFRSCYQPKMVSVATQTVPISDVVPPPTPAIPYGASTRPRSYAHFPIGQQMQVPGSYQQGQFTDCMICGKPFEQIGDEIVIDFIHHTKYPGEPYYVKAASRRAFIEGMHAGTYFLIPRRVSQAAACDGNVYAIPQGAIMTNTTPNNLPLL